MAAVVEVAGEEIEEKEKGALTAIGDGEIFRSDRPTEFAPQKPGQSAQKPRIPLRRVVIDEHPVERVLLFEHPGHALAPDRLHLGNCGRISAAEHEHVRLDGHRAAEIIHQFEDAAARRQLVAKVRKRIGHGCRLPVIRYLSSAMKRPHRRTHADLDRRAASMSEDQLVAAVGEEPAALVLILDCVQDPHNLGACLRTADAAGALAVVVPRDRSVSVTETVRHVAAGAAEHLPVVAVTNLARAMDRLKEAGLWLVGAADEADADFYALDLSGRIGLVMGAEGSGLRRLTAEKCDHLVRLPMAGTVSCLNVSVAAGVCLFECVRQRRRNRSPAAQHPV